MNIKNGSIVILNKNFSQIFTKNINDYSFLLISFTDISVTIKSLLNNKVYTIRADLFFENLKSVEDSRAPQNKQPLGVKKNIDLEKKDIAIYSFEPKPHNIKVNISGTAASSKISSATNNPYFNDPFNSIYGK